MLTSIARAYKWKFYPHIKNIPGAWRLRHELDQYTLRKEEKINEDGDSIFSQDPWDNLILLDACRYDVYNNIVGGVEERISRGSCTKEYIKKTYSEGLYADVVYVTANPQMHRSRFKNCTGRRREQVFADVQDLYLSHWDSKDGTVLPKTVVNETLKMKDKYPEKRIVAHFMQPHTPFLTMSREQRKELGIQH
jgi:hypothetical protein